MRETQHGVRRGWLARAGLLAALGLTGCMSAPVAAQRSAEAPGQAAAEFVDPATLDSEVPAPSTVLGHEIGARPARYGATVRYLQALTEASPLATLTPYAESHEGRTLYYLTITSEVNHRRLDTIRAEAGRLADPRTLDNGDEAMRIIDTLPGIAWLAYSIHGDELSSTDAALQVAYQLVAGRDDDTVRLRDELVIHIDPLQNPDGRERYLSQLEPLAGKVPNPDYQAVQHTGLWSAGRGNHYLFDLNRDWLPQVHPETRGRAEAILRWNPHLVVDSHEMGSLDTYLFDPPREPFNVNLSPRNLAWRRTFSTDQAAAFDRHGWSYYTREWYEEWYPGYTNAWANLLGAVGILYEQAGVNGAAIKQPSGQLLTYRESVHHHVVSSLANLRTLRKNRREILRDFFEDRKWAVTAARSGHDALLVPPMRDTAKLRRFLDVLERSGIEYAFAARNVAATEVVDLYGGEEQSRTFPDGTLIVRAAQPHRRLLRAALEFDPHMSNGFLTEERSELEKRHGSKLYDVTAWNLCMAFGLEVYWAGAVEGVSLTQERPTRGEWSDAPARYGYLIDGADATVFQGIVRLLENDCKVRVAEKPFSIAGREYRPGTVLLRKHENPSNLASMVKPIVEEIALRASPVDAALVEDGPDLGGQHFRLLAAPQIALMSQWPVSTTSFGAVWHLLDARTGLRVSPVNVQRFGRLDLRQYNVIVVPDTWRAEVLEAIFNESAREKLRSWIEAGGTLIGLGDAAAFVAGPDRKLSQVRLRRDVLEQIDAYEEAVRREREARNVEIVPAEVWGTGVSAPDGGESNAEDSDAGKPGAKPDKEALARKDAWSRLFRPHGAIAAGMIDPEHWLCFGVTGDVESEPVLPVLLSGDHALMAKHPVRTAVRLAPAERIRLSGLLWPEARERWANTAYATVERVGNGQIILFATDPFFRGYFEGSGRLLLNALILGPGMGTSQPVPW